MSLHGGKLRRKEANVHIRGTQDAKFHSEDIDLNAKEGLIEL